MIPIKALRLRQQAVAVTGIAFDPTATNSGVTLSNSNRTATRTSGSNSGVARATVSKSSGKWYTEFLVGNAASGNLAIGLVNVSFNPLGILFLGESIHGWGHWADGSRWYGNGVTNGYASYTATDVIAMAWDATVGNLWFAKNNVWNGDPVLATAPAFASTSVNGTLWPAVDCNVSGAAATIRRAVDYSYTPPTGFSAWA